MKVAGSLFTILPADHYLFDNRLFETLSSFVKLQHLFLRIAFPLFVVISQYNLFAFRTIASWFFWQKLSCFFVSFL